MQFYSLPSIGWFFVCCERKKGNGCTIMICENANVRNSLVWTRTQSRGKMKRPTQEPMSKGNYSQRDRWQNLLITIIMKWPTRLTSLHLQRAAGCQATQPCYWPREQLFHSGVVAVDSIGRHFCGLAVTNLAVAARMVAPCTVGRAGFCTNGRGRHCGFGDRPTVLCSADTRRES